VIESEVEIDNSAIIGLEIFDIRWFEKSLSEIDHEVSLEMR
jgi:hypothetical protein